MINADQLLAGSNMTLDVDIPERLLPEADAGDRRVRLRPLTVQDLRRISRAARDNDDLSSALMVQQALVEPELSLQQINRLPAGLLHFLLHQVNELSGVGITEQAVADRADHPMIQAAFELSRAFGWTPDQISELTLGQIMVHLHMIRHRPAEADTTPGTNTPMARY